MPADLTINHLEVLHHHADYGSVWDGDQISKSHRDDLVRRGFLIRIDGTGHHVLTRFGASIAHRTRSRWRLLEWLRWHVPARGLRGVLVRALTRSALRMIPPEAQLVRASEVSDAG